MILTETEQDLIIMVALPLQTLMSVMKGKLDLKCVKTHVTTHSVHLYVVALKASASQMMVSTAPVSLIYDITLQTRLRTLISFL